MKPSLKHHAACIAIGILVGIVLQLFGVRLPGAEPSDPLAPVAAASAVSVDVAPVAAVPVVAVAIAPVAPAPAVCADAEALAAAESLAPSVAAPDAPDALAPSTEAAPASATLAPQSGAVAAPAALAPSFAPAPAAAALAPVVAAAQTKEWAAATDWLAQAPNPAPPFSLDAVAELQVQLRGELRQRGPTDAMLAKIQAAMQWAANPPQPKARR